MGTLVNLGDCIEWEGQRGGGGLRASTSCQMTPDVPATMLAGDHARGGGWVVPGANNYDGFNCQNHENMKHVRLCSEGRA